MRLPILALALAGALVVAPLAACGLPASSSPLAAPRDAPIAASEPPAGGPAGSVVGVDLTQFSTGDPDSPWVVVNKAHPLDPAGYEPQDLVVVHGYLVRAVAADDLAAMLDDAAAQGVSLTLRSAYRSYGKQADVYDGWVSQLGQVEADRVSARPGYSEHQTGLVVDVGSSTQDSCDFDDCFADTVEGQWVSANAQRFGFLVRYTAENETVTGYAQEAWHLRFVGRPLAAAMTAAGVSTLEELFGVDGGPAYR